MCRALSASEASAQKLLSENDLPAVVFQALVEANVESPAFRGPYDIPWEVSCRLHFRYRAIQ